MVSVLVCIPTVPGRQPYLANAARGYERGTSIPGARTEFNLSIVFDAGSAGEGWQRCVEQGLEWFPETTHIHFSNDDVVVARGWLEPLVEATNRGFVPAMRIEPAGGHLGGHDEVIFQTHPPMPPDYPSGWVPRNAVAYFFAGLPEEQPTVDFTEINHGNLPFCSVEQWRQIGPFPPIHYGSDGWFAEKARKCGWPTVAMIDSVAFNYCANIGRHPGDGWEEQDVAAFDGVFARDAYEHGLLEPQETHPWRMTPHGLALVKEWREAHESPSTVWTSALQDPKHRLRLLREWLEAH